MSARIRRPAVRSITTLALAIVVLAGCAGTPERDPIVTAEQVDLERFMGRWYVIANIPTFIETGAHNATETYRLDADGTIDTIFTFRDGAFDGETKTYNPRGFVLDTESNAVWGMRFVWPFKADYRIVYLNDDYSQTIIGRDKRDYMWIMARTPTIPEADLLELIELLGAEGYDTSKIERVPQRWD